MSSEPREALVSCVDLVVGHRGKALLPPISLTLRRGEIWAVIGRNGSGKTSFMKSVLSLHPPISGEVRRERGGLRIAYLAQRQAYDDFYPLLARDVVGMGLERQRTFWRRPLRDRDERIARALARCGAAELAERPFRQLSEGQKQRVLFARVAVGEPDLALLDEPTSAMDLVAERESFELIARLAAELRLSVVIVSHYLGVVRKFADRALLLDRELGSVVQGTPSEPVPRLFGQTPFTIGSLQFDTEQVGLVVTVLAVAAISVPVLMLSPTGLPRLRNLEEERHRADEEVSRLSSQIAALRAEVARIKTDPAAVERAARDELGLVRTTEVVFQFSD